MRLYVQKMSSCLLQFDRNRGIDPDRVRSDHTIHRHDSDTGCRRLTQGSTECRMGGIIGLETADLFHLYDEKHVTLKSFFETGSQLFQVFDTPFRGRIGKTAVTVIFESNALDFYKRLAVTVFNVYIKPRAFIGDFPFDNRL
jgi:hypothetical protein